MEKSDHCSLEGYNSLNKFQRTQLPRAIRDFHKRNPKIQDIDTAGIEFIQSENYRAWASGLKARYCNFLCPMSESCGIVYDVPHYPQEDVELPFIRLALEERGFGFIYEVSKREFQAEVGRNKWFLSQRRNYDVSWDDAQIDYVKNFLDDFRRGFCVNNPPEVVERELKESNLKNILLAATSL